MVCVRGCVCDCVCVTTCVHVCVHMRVWIGGLVHARAFPVQYYLGCVSVCPETKVFYRALSQVGTDFTMMTLLVEGRTRGDLKVGGV